MKLSEIHFQILEKGATGHCLHMQWGFILAGALVSVTRQVKVMERHGLIRIYYHPATGSAKTKATEAGRESVRKARAAQAA